MPAPPIIGQRAGGQRVIKVFGKTETEHATKADGHVRISRKIEIDLNGIADGAKPCHRDRQPVGGHIAHARPKLARGVGQQHLFGKSAHKRAQAACQCRDRMIAARQLLVHVAISHDRARDELWKQRHVGAKRDGIALCVHLAAIDVDDIGKRLEGIKRNTDGERQSKGRKSRQRGNGTQIIQDEAAVFEKA